MPGKGAERMIVLWIFLSVILLYLCLIFWTGYKGYYFPMLNKSTSAGKKKVACVGDSITYGFAIPNWFFHHYPYILQILMGKEYAVRNFGLSGSTAMCSAKMSYRARPPYLKSLRFAPDLVVIMLGTNDANAQNWKGKDTFYSEYRELLSSYQTTEGHPAIYIMTPPPLFSEEDGSLMNMNLKDVRECVFQLAADMSLSVIDLFKETQNHLDWFQADGLHPNAKGAMEIAHIVYQHISNVCVLFHLQIKPLVSH